MKHLFVVISFICLVVNGISQDKVLFKVDDTPVYTSEFRYIYEKNNGENADFSKESIEEYLDLYIKFKLKVERAKELRLDTIPELNEELKGYRKQLASSFLYNKEIVNKICEDVYDKMQYDVKISHILSALSDDADQETKGRAEEKIYNAHERIVNGGLDFGTLAKGISDDPSAKNNSGMIGWWTAPLPDGFVEFENVMTNTPIGQISKPFKSPLGLHILRVEDRRPARGKIEVAHIVIHKVKNGRPNSGAEELAKEIYQKVKSGESFAQLAKKHSDDKLTSETGGYLGYFGINEYDQVFEDAAFGLEKDGSVSAPIETSLGYHIIKRISKKNLKDKPAVISEIKKKLEKSSRIEDAKEKKAEEIKKKANYKENEEAIINFVNTINNSFRGQNWNKPIYSDTELFSFGNEISFSEREVAENLDKEVLKRQRLGKEIGPKRAAMAMINDFIVEQAFAYEEARLEANYPDFAALMKEYEEGILLFEITKQNVWNRASEDTTGLKKFFLANRSKYSWDDRVKIGIYEIESKDDNFVSKVSDFILKDQPEMVINTMDSEGKKMISYKEKIIDQTDELLANRKISEGEQYVIPRSDEVYIVQILELLPASLKELSEAKGYVIADYQDLLEKQWLVSLEDRFKVKVNKGAKKSLIK